jgi:hypothetical protein
MSKNFSELRGFGEAFTRFASVRPGDHTKHPFRLRNLQRTDPWAFDNEQVRALLLQSFPNYKTNPRQKNRMQIWMYIIHRYFREGATARMIAEYFLEQKGLWEPPDSILRQKQKSIEHTIRRIRKVAAGLNSKGKTRKKMGRPRDTSIRF